MGTTVELSQSTRYTDSKGRVKAAIVTATPESLHPEGSIKLVDNQVMLTVFSPGGNTYSRLAEFDESDGTFHKADLTYVESADDEGDYED